MKLPLNLSNLPTFTGRESRAPILPAHDIIRAEYGRKNMTKDPELLIGLSDGELEALAEGVLSPAAQIRLDELLARNTEGQLSATEQAELDRLLDRVDYLTTVETRARLTLHQRVAASRT